MVAAQTTHRKIRRSEHTITDQARTPCQESWSPDRSLLGRYRTRSAVRAPALHTNDTRAVSILSFICMSFLLCLVTTIRSHRQFRRTNRTFPGHPMDEADTRG